MVMSLHTLIVSAGGVLLEPIQGDLTIDERRSPYTQARFEVVTPTNSDALAALNVKGGEVRGYARVDYRDPVTAEKVTRLAGGQPVTCAKLTAALAGRTFGAVTAQLSRWSNPYMTERTAGMLPFRLVVTRSTPDPIKGTTEVELSSLEVRLTDFRRLTDGATIPAGKAVPELVAEVLAAVDSTYVLGPVDERYETVPTYFVTSQEVQWRVGVSAWDFLDPIMQAAGVTLQCTPDGAWRLVRANAATFYTVSFDRVTELEAREDRDQWGDAVLLIYRWRDSAGVQQQRTDYAAANASPRKTIVIEHRDVPYPGPGAAVTILDRVQRLAREITIEAVSAYEGVFGQPIRPGIAVAASSQPGAVISEQGRATAMRWEWPKNRMTITARS